MKDTRYVREYFTWLVDIIWYADYDASYDFYNNLMWQLFCKDFRWSIDNDCNRATDGEELRGIFRSHIYLDEDGHTIALRNSDNSRRTVISDTDYDPDFLQECESEFYGENGPEIRTILVPAKCDILVSKHCSVLEMMVALSLRIEHEIMHDNTKGDRTWLWFRDMIDNLGLVDYDDPKFDKDYVNGKIDEILDIFLDRKYNNCDRIGNIFVSEVSQSVTNVTEIWYQMFDYLSENYNL